jgi:uncharacterized protein (DUF736 family)
MLTFIAHNLKIKVMARMEGKFIVGVIGEYVYRMQNGVQIVSRRLKKNEMKQSEETKKHGNTFGLASKLTAGLRKTLMAQIGQMSQAEMRNRLNGVAVSVLSDCRNRGTQHYEFDEDSFRRFEGFEFNATAPLKNKLLNLPQVDLSQGRLTITFEGLAEPNKLKFKGPNTVRCVLTTCLSLFKLRAGKMLNLAQAQTLELFKNSLPESAQQIEFTVPEGCFYTVTLFIEYFTASRIGWVPLKTSEPAVGRILSAALAPGEEQDDKSVKWVKSAKLL